MAKKCMNYREIRRKFARPGSQSLPDLRTPAWFYAPLWPVPHLFPRVSPVRADSRRDQVILVASPEVENERE